MTPRIHGSCAVGTAPPADRMPRRRPPCTKSSPPPPAVQAPRPRPLRPADRPVHPRIDTSRYECHGSGSTSVRSAHQQHIQFTTARLSPHPPPTQPVRFPRATGHARHCKGFSRTPTLRTRVPFARDSANEAEPPTKVTSHGHQHTRLQVGSHRLPAVFSLRTLAAYHASSAVSARGGHRMRASHVLAVCTPCPGKHSSAGPLFPPARCRRTVHSAVHLTNGPLSGT